MSYKYVFAYKIDVESIGRRQVRIVYERYRCSQNIEYRNKNNRYNTITPVEIITM